LKFLLIFLFLVLSSCSHIKAPPREIAPVILSWVKNYEIRNETGNLPISLNSPYIYEGVLFIGSSNDAMRAYDVETGKEFWSVKDGNDVVYSGTPIVHNDYVIYGTSTGRIFSRQYVTGNLKYDVDLGSSIEGQPAILKNRIFFHLRNHKILCLDIETGKVIWVYGRSIAQTTTIQRTSTPYIKDNVLYVGFADGYVGAISVEEGLLLWEKKLTNDLKFVDVDPTPVISNNLLYATSLSGPLSVLNPKSGEVLRQVQVTPSRTPIFRDEKIYVPTVDGDVVILDKNLQIVAKKNFSDRGVSSLVFFKNYLAATTVDGKFLCLDPITLEKKYEFKMGHAFSAVFGDVALGDKNLAFLSSRNRLYVFK
jgi:outer membrane protein assembly factor BamB